MAKVMSLVALAAVLVVGAIFPTLASADGPVVSSLSFGDSSMSFDAHDKSSATTRGGAKIFLNVQAKAMTKPQRRAAGGCRREKVGTPFLNEVVDPQTGRP
jgi:hypothetical protein